MRLSGDYMWNEGPLYQVMATWPCHIEYFERQYYKAFVGDRIFRADILDIIYKRVHIFLHLCNTPSLNAVDIGALLEFVEFQRQLEWFEWTTTTPTWAELLS